MTDLEIFKKHNARKVFECVPGDKVWSMAKEAELMLVNNNYQHDKYYNLWVKDNLCCLEYVDNLTDLITK
jgi:hypothetical protein